MIKNLINIDGKSKAIPINKEIDTTDIGIGDIVSVRLADENEEAIIFVRIVRMFRNGNAYYEHIGNTQPQPLIALR